MVLVSLVCLFSLRLILAPPFTSQDGKNKPAAAFERLTSVRSAFAASQRLRQDCANQ